MHGGIDWNGLGNLATAAYPSSTIFQSGRSTRITSHPVVAERVRSRRRRSPLGPLIANPLRNPFVKLPGQQHGLVGRNRDRTPSDSYRFLRFHSSALRRRRAGIACIPALLRFFFPRASKCRRAPRPAPSAGCAASPYRASACRRRRTTGTSPRPYRPPAPWPGSCP